MIPGGHQQGQRYRFCTPACLRLGRPDATILHPFRTAGEEAVKRGIADRLVVVARGCKGVGMSKSQGKPLANSTVMRATAGLASRADFDEVLAMIEAARARALSMANTTLIDLYWTIGKHITRKIANDGWGKGTVRALASYIQRRRPNARGYSASNIWRMMQFYEAYRNKPKLAPLVRELSWTHNLLIIGRSKRDEEREFYLRICLRERWGKRQLARQLDGALFERTILSPVNLAPAVRDLHPDAASIFKDTYLVEFLNLPSEHSEADLHDGLVLRLKDFLIELGRDFCFVGSHYPLQVGGRDFEIDLLFFHRGLNCLVDFELKIEEFQPEHLGKLEFYLEALDRDVRKPHENPTIGVLLCAAKDHEVVEYALSRAASPALVAEYQTNLPDKALLRATLHEFYELAMQSSPKGDAKVPNRPVSKRPGKRTGK
jgi:predicted nuclease of restriction endonuclease-like (RecB) superfamily